MTDTSSQLSNATQVSEHPPWSDFLGHGEVLEMLARMLSSGRLASTFLLVGPEGIGKRTLARKWAQSLLCQRESQKALTACGECPGCRQVLANTHPDLYQIGREGEASLGVKPFIGDGDRRGREGLCRDISLKPFHGGRKIAIIDDADFMTVEAANCLLKTLEEPPPHSLLMLIATREQNILPTIRSRCQTIRFGSLETEQVADLLLAQEVVETRPEAMLLASIADGSLERARILAEADGVAFRLQLLKLLSHPQPHAAHLNRLVADYVADAGSETPRKRLRFRIVLDMSIPFFQQLQRRLVGAPALGDETLVQAVETAAGHWSRRDPETAGRCLTRCFEAIQHADANANVQGTIECWADELIRIVRGETLGIG